MHTGLSAYQLVRLSKQNHHQAGAHVQSFSAPIRRGHRPMADPPYCRLDSIPRLASHAQQMAVPGTRVARRHS